MFREQSFHSVSQKVGDFTSQPLQVLIVQSIATARKLDLLDALREFAVLHELSFQLTQQSVDVGIRIAQLVNALDAMANR